MRLVGKKLYRVGPLKCFKGSNGGGGGGGGGGSGAHPSRERAIGVKEAEKERQQQQQQRSSQAARERDARQAEVRRQEKLRQEAAARAKAKAEEQQRQRDAQAARERDARQAEARKKELARQEQEREAQRLAQKGLRETKETEIGAEKEQQVQKTKQQQMLSDREDALRKRQAIMDYEKNVIDASEYEAVTGEKPKQRSLLTRRNFIKALGLVPEAGKPLQKIGEKLSEQFSEPTTVTEAAEDIAVESEEKEQRKDVGRQPVVPTPSRGPSPTPAPPVAAPAPAPAPKPEPKPVEQMSADEVGESIVKKEAQMIRERSLAQQLAQIRGLRGVSPGQKMRLLQRSQERFDREFAPQVQVAMMKEREARRKEQLGLSEAQKERDLRLEMAKLKGTGGVSLAKDDRPSWLKALDATAEGLDKATDIMGTFDIDFSDLNPFEEGGFVSGPGSETSDSIPARLSDGEFVIKASAVRGLGKAMGAEGKEEERAKGVDFLYKLQDKMGKKVQKFGGGGPVKKEEPEVEKGEFVPSKKYGKLDEDKKRKLLRERQKMLQMAKKMGIKVEMKKYKDGGEIEPDYDRFLKFMDKGVSHSLMKKRIQKARIPKQEKEKLLKGLGKEPKFAEGGEAYSRPKKAFKEAIGYESESRFHDKALKDTKHGGARRKFRHFQDGGFVDIPKPDMVKDQFKMPSSGYGSVVAAQGDLMRRIEELERKVGK